MSRSRTRHSALTRAPRTIAGCCARHPAATMALWRAFVLAIIVLIALEVRALAMAPVVDDALTLPRATPTVVAADAVALTPVTGARRRMGR